MVRPTLALSSPVSLTTDTWTCLHFEAWEEKHKEYFAKSNLFYRFTISQPSPFRRQKRPGDPVIKSVDSWVLSAKDGTLCGLFALQKIMGDFSTGIVFFELETTQSSINPESVLAQVISMLFMALAIDTLKIIALNDQSLEVAKTTMPVPLENVLTFSRDLLPDPIRPITFQIDRVLWFESPAGQNSLSSLNWLQRKINRQEAAWKFEHQEPKRPWIYSLLTFLKPRRRSEPMVHPLDQLRTFRRPSC